MYFKVQTLDNPMGKHEILFIFYSLGVFWYFSPKTQWSGLVPGATDLGEKIFQTAQHIAITYLQRGRP